MDVTDITPPGSTFGMTLPVALLIEDDPQDAQLLCEAFREHEVGVRVIIASTAAKALGMLRLLPSLSLPRLMVLDIGLPGLSGHDILNTFQANPQWRPIPKVVLTSSCSDTDRIRSLERGAVAHVVKPATFRGYLDLVDSWT